MRGRTRWIGTVLSVALMGCAAEETILPQDSDDVASDATDAESPAVVGTAGAIDCGSQDRDNFAADATLLGQLSSSSVTRINQSVGGTDGTDWFRYTGIDDPQEGYDNDVTVELTDATLGLDSGARITVTQYIACHAGNQKFECPSGTTKVTTRLSRAVTVHGRQLTTLQGCSKTADGDGNATIVHRLIESIVNQRSYNCSTTQDDADVFIRTTLGPTHCQGYDLTVTHD